MKIGMIWAAVLLVALPAISEAKPFTFGAAGITVDVPRGWKSSVSDGTLTVETKDGNLAVVISSAPNITSAQGYDLLKQQFEKTFQNSKIGTRKNGAIGGMPGFVATATGDVQGMKMEASLVSLQGPGKRVLIVMALGVKGKYEKYGSAMSNTLMSLKPIGAKASTPAPSNKRQLAAAAKIGAQTLNHLPKSSRKSVVNFIDAFMSHDKAMLKALISTKGVTRLKEGKWNWGMVIDDVDVDGIPKVAKAYFGWEDPDEQWQVDKRSKREVWIYRGSGYGDANVAVFKKERKGWFWTAVKSHDFGAP